MENASEGTGLVPVDLEALFTAFEDRAGDRAWYLDRDTGEVCPVCESRDDEDELPDTLDALEETRRFVPVGHEQTYDAVRDREEFAATTAAPLRTWLEHALSGRLASRRFERVLQGAPAEHERWVRFRNARVEARARRWLEDRGVPVAQRHES